MEKKIMIAVLVLAVVLYGVVAFSKDARTVPEGTVESEGEIIFNSNRIQSGIKSDKALSELAKSVSPMDEDAISYGFAAKSEEAKIFIIGALYSEGLAYLKSGNLDMAKTRVQSISMEFLNLDVPTSLFNYTSKIRNMLTLKEYSTEVLVDFYTLFQPFYEDYARGLGENELILARAGSWFVDMSLTAAAGDRAMLKQTETIDYFIKEMKRMDAPKGVLDALDKIAKVAQKDDISEKDIEKVLESVKKIQTILG